MSNDNRAQNLESNFDLTESWVEIGGRINTKGSSNIALWLKGSLNSSDAVMFRGRCYAGPETTDAYGPQIQTIGSDVVVMNEEVYQITDSTFGLVTPLGLSSLVPFVQIEMKVLTAGATAAHIDEALISFDRKPV